MLAAGAQVLDRFSFIEVVQAAVVLQPLCRVIKLGWDRARIIQIFPGIPFKIMVDQGWGGRITPPAPSAPWKDFIPPNFTLPEGHSAADPFGFRADIVRHAQHQGSWSNSVTNHNVNMGGQKTTINIDGGGMDPHSMADMIGRKQVRVHADFLRNAKSAIS